MARLGPGPLACGGGRRLSGAPDGDRARIGAHYGRAGLGERVLDAVRAAGSDPGRLTPDELAPVDQLHTGGRTATLELARLAGVRRDDRVLDVGGGLGGPARTLAATIGCRVTVLDLAEELCQAGAVLTGRTGLHALVHACAGDATALPFANGSVDVVLTQHSSMNVADKRALYAEIARVLRPGGRFALHEIVAGSGGTPHFPVPWAGDDAISFLLPADAVRATIAGAGLAEHAWSDVTAASLAWFRSRPAPPAAGTAPPLGLHLLLGDAAGTSLRNAMRNMEEGRVAVVTALFERAA